jgi:hypothetical protein
MKKLLHRYLCILIPIIIVTSGCVGRRNEEISSRLMPVYHDRSGEMHIYEEKEGKENKKGVFNTEDGGPPPAVVTPPLINKADVAVWVDTNYTGYYQQYNLSCEPAMVRMICGIWGIQEISEDEIMELMPKHPVNPELGFVMEDVRGDIVDTDGSPYWANYGAHAPVVLETLKTILDKNGLSNVYRVEMVSLIDKELIRFLKDEEDCLGAIIWVAAYINDKKPPVNDIGQVLGEHVQFVSPQLDSKGRMLVYDVWPWENQPFHLLKPFNRDMFDYRTIVVMRNEVNGDR